MISTIKSAIRTGFRTCFGYDLSVLRTKVEDDFLDQKAFFMALQATPEKPGKAKVKTIFDVGANVGQTTMKYKKLFPWATVYGFEPFPEAYDAYVRKFSGDARVKPQNIALSDKNGSVDFFVNDCHYTNSLLPINKNNGADTLTFKPTGTAKVAAETLDAACARLEIDAIDILKLDVQGGELLVLKGASAMLKARRISLIYSEVEYSPLYEGQPLYEDIRKFLEGFGYEAKKTYNVSMSAASTPVSGDVIFTLIKK